MTPITQTLEIINIYNKSIDQLSGNDPSSKKISNAKKLHLESQRDTLVNIKTVMNTQNLLKAWKLQLKLE